MLERLKNKVSKGFFFVFHAGFKISNFNVFTAKHLKLASWTDLGLKRKILKIYIHLFWDYALSHNSQPTGWLIERLVEAFEFPSLSLYGCNKEPNHLGS